MLHLVSQLQSNKADEAVALLAELACEHDMMGLSMGMSTDYETAVTLSATHVRVGSTLFGARA